MNMTSNNPENKNEAGYFAIIPATIRYDNNLSALAKLFYAEITCLSNKKGHCWAKNQYLMDCFNISDRTCNRIINQLKDSGYISVIYNYKKGSKQIISRNILISGGLPVIASKSEDLIVSDGGDKNDGICGDIFVQVGGDKNGEDNNKRISNNNTSTKKVGEDVVALYHSILPMLPKVMKLTTARCNKIVTRLSEMEKGIETMQAVFIRVSQSPYLLGKVNSWHTDFDWIITNDTHWVWIMEGKYDDKKKLSQEKAIIYNSPQNTSQSDFEEI